MNEQNTKTGLAGNAEVYRAAYGASLEPQTGTDAGVTMGLPAATSERGGNCVEASPNIPESMPTPNNHPVYDPQGFSAHDPGAKLDGGKVRLGLVLHGFPRALMVVGEIGTYGAGKYSDNGWMQVPDGESRYTDAMYRHLMAEAAGEATDRESGLLHAAHAAWNALARLELLLRGEDVRP